MNKQTVPKIVCICGSTRFATEIAAANEAESMAGNIVVAPSVNMHDAKYLDMPEGERESVKARLDALHLAKIDMATDVLVINKDGYIGDSTCREAIYAYRARKEIRWLEPDRAPHPLELTQRPPFKLHRYKVGIGTNVAFVEAPTPEAAVVFYGTHAIKGNATAQLMVAVYAEDGVEKGYLPWARWALGQGNEAEFQAALKAIQPQIRRCKFVAADEEVSL